jgi:hypothetical protein
MELDELKNIWKQSPAKFQFKNETQLASMLKGSSKSAVAKLKKSVWFELGFTIVAGLALLIYAMSLPSGSLKWTTVSILALFVAYSFYYVKKLLLLATFKPADDHLKANLEKLTASLTGYMKFYKRSYTILYPIYFGLGLLFGGLESGSDKFLQIISEPKIILYLVFIAIAFFFLSTWFANWYFKKLYGNHIEKLKAILRDLNANEAVSE